MKRRAKVTLTLWALATFCLAGAPGNADDGDYERLGRQLAELAAMPPAKARAGVYVADVFSGTEIFATRGDQQINPASNVKIVTAACALKKLGPEFRFLTSLHGKKEGAAVRGPLYMKGHADPSLDTADLWALARELKNMGVRRIEGGIVVDDTYFDGDNLPFAYDQQPDEDAAFRAPVGAVSLNYNAIAITIRPSSQAMRPAVVIVEPPDYVALTNDTLTVGQGSHNPKISAQKSAERSKVRVWGQVPLSSRAVTYYRRGENPSLLSGYGLKGVLEKVGINIGGGVQVGALPPDAPKLAEHRARPLSEVLWETGKLSNNFVTEMVLKTVGAESAKGPGSWDSATGAVAEVLANWGINEGSYTYRNGSGLFDANRFSARQFVTVLRAAYLDSSIRPEFVSQLATGGVDGTVRSRYRKDSAKRYVRAKTGTLNDVSALSGYVFDREGRRPVAFSILVDNADGYVSASRAYQEKIVTAIADFLNRN